MLMGYLFKKILKTNHTCQIIRTISQNVRRTVKPQNVSESLSVPEYIEKPSKPLNLINSYMFNPNNVEIKSEEQIKRMRDACKISKEILLITASHVQDGITTNELDIIAHEACVKRNCYPSPLHYRGYPKSICTSVNNVVCHGIPDDLILQNGDIINIDITVFYRGYHGDLSKTFEVGKKNTNCELIKVNEFSRDQAISVCGPNTPFNVIGKTIQTIADDAHLSIVPYFCGHGIGEYFHGPPDIYHFANEEDGFMKSGMTFTIEPIFCDGSPEIEILDDEWTAVTIDESWSAQCEHTILINDNGCEILTMI